MADAFENVMPSVTDPAGNIFQIVPDDLAEIDPLPKALLFDQAGQVTLRGSRGTADVTINVLPGQVLDVRAQYVRATGTNIIGIFGLAD